MKTEGRRGERWYSSSSFFLFASSSFVCLEASVILSPVTEYDRHMEEVGRRIEDGINHGTLNNLSCLHN